VTVPSSHAPTGPQTAVDHEADLHASAVRTRAAALCDKARVGVGTGGLKTHSVAACGGSVVRPREPQPRRGLAGPPIRLGSAADLILHPREGFSDPPEGVGLREVFEEVYMSAYPACRCAANRPRVRVPRRRLLVSDAASATDDAGE
jgi:hypothetical protein